MAKWFHSFFYVETRWKRSKLRFMRERELEQRVMAVEAELLADVGPVVLDRPVGDEEVGGDLLARFVAGNQVQDALLDRRQVVEARLAVSEVLRAAAPRSR